MDVYLTSIQVSLLIGVGSKVQSHIDFAWKKKEKNEKKNSIRNLTAQLSNSWLSTKIGSPCFHKPAQNVTWNNSSEVLF